MVSVLIKMISVSFRMVSVLSRMVSVSFRMLSVSFFLFFFFVWHCVRVWCFDFDLRHFVCFCRHPRCIVYFSHELFEVFPQDTVWTIEIVYVNVCVIHHRVLRCGHTDDSACIDLESVSWQHFVYKEWNELAAVERC